MIEMNTGTDSQGRSFRAVFSSYLYGGDETCFLASIEGRAIIGERYRKKHEKVNEAGRTSITVYRTGNAAGENGPTAFLPAGVKRDASFTNQFHVSEGCNLYQIFC